MPDKKINLVISLVPVGPRTLKSEFENRHFAIHLAAAFDPDTPPETDDERKMLLPWKSDWRILDIKVAVNPAPANRPTTTLVNSKKNPNPTPAMERLREEVILDSRNFSRLKNEVWEFNEPPTVEPKLIETVNTISLYPGAIPNDSRLLHYFKIVPNGWTPADGDKLVVAPVIQIAGRIFTPDVFNFTPDPAQNPQNRWTYNPVEGFEMKGIVKPLVIEVNDDNIVLFDEEPGTRGAADVGLNFQTYWLRAQPTHPWSENLDDYADQLTNVPARMAEARSNFELQRQQFLSVWEDWQLMALALFTQWSDPNDAGNQNPEINNGKRIKERLAELRRPNPAQTYFDAADIGRLTNSLTSLRSNLSRTTNTREQVRDTWLNIFRRGLADAELNAQTLLLRVKEKPEEFDLALFYIWDFAVQTSNAEVLKTKWNAALREKRADFLEIFTGRADAENYGVRIIRQNIRNRRLNALTQAKDLAEVKTKITDSLKNAFDNFEQADFVPHIIKKPEVTAQDLSAITEVWESYIDAYVKQITDEQPTESKPGGLTIQIDALEKRTQADSPLVNQANWRKLNGVGLLVREKEANWSVVNAATVQLREIVIKKAEWQTDKIVKLTVRIRPSAGDRHDLIIGDLLFREVFQTNADGSGIGLPNDEIEITPLRENPREVLLVSLKGANMSFDRNRLPRFEFPKITALLDNNALVPVSVPYKKGVRHPFLTYNQRSLIEPSSLAGAVNPYFNVTDERNAGALSWAAPYEYGKLTRGDNSLFNLVQLKFGKGYEMAAFMIDTAGGLPNDLANALPWIFKDRGANTNPPDKPPDFNPKFSVPDGVAIKFENYWRKVPVGQVRVSAGNIVSGSGKFEPKNWTEIPEKVSPLAWEVEAQNQLRPKEDLPVDLRRTQLTLLTESSGEFFFGVRPPTVDIDVLERWLPKAQNDQLKLTLKDYFNLLKSRGGQISDNLDDSGSDTSIDDPAVEKLLFVLEKYDFDTVFAADQPVKRWKVAAICEIPVSPADGTEGIRRYQSDWIKVKCVRSDRFEVKESSGTTHDVLVSIPGAKVEVARLRIMSLVSNRFIKNAPAEPSDPKFNEGFFNAEFLEDFSRYVIEDNALREKIRLIERDNFCLKPQQILLETPNAALPAEEEIWRAMKLKRLAPGNDVIQISLSETDRKANPMWRNIIRCELLRQQWRWQGRPLPRKNDENENLIEKLSRRWAPEGVVVRNEDREFLLWEMKAFAGMDEDFDTLHFPLQFSHNAPPLLYEDKFDKDLPARYLRYGLRLFSRYEGLFDVEPRTGKQPFEDTNLKLSGIGWQRAFVPYRSTEKLLPKVRAIVPLTQSFTENERSGNGKVASLMLVMDETFFSQCGFTEWIEGEVVKVQDWRPVDDLLEEESPKKVLHQTGYDPIITINNAQSDEATGRKLPEAAEHVLKLKLEGPFGHTTDTGARQPLFAHSSFVIEPAADIIPPVDNTERGKNWEFSGWDFVKVRFRRLSGSETADAAAETEWTDPVWVQFLPSAEFVSDALWQFEIKITDAEDNKNKFSVRCHAVNPTIEENPLRELRSYPMFRYCLLLTYRISDFRGQTENEAYADYLMLDENFDSRADSFQTFIKRAGDLRARLVEIQSTPKIEGGVRKYFEPDDENLWEELLKPDRNTRFRITRISPPFEVSGNKQP